MMSISGIPILTRALSWSKIALNPELATGDLAAEHQLRRDFERPPRPLRRQRRREQPPPPVAHLPPPHAPAGPHVAQLPLPAGGHAVQGFRIVRTCDIWAKLLHLNCRADEQYPYIVRKSNYRLRPGNKHVAKYSNDSQQCFLP